MRRGQHPLRPRLMHSPGARSVSFISRVIGSLVLALSMATAAAQSYPSKPIRIVIAFPPGGSSDLLARELAQKMQQNIGEPVIVDNKPGGGGIIAAEQVAASAPDGHTLLLSLDSVMTMDPAMRSKMSFSPERDFAPIGTVAVQNLIFAMHPKVPIQSIRELVTYAKANPGKLTYGTSTLIGQLIGEKLKSDLGAAMLHVPYRGAQQMTQAVLSGDVDLVISGVLPYATFAKEGKLRVLATTGTRREPQLPDTPTLVELGYSEFDLKAWFWMFAPAGTPIVILDRVNAEIGRALGNDALKARLTNFGLVPATSTRDELAVLMKSESARWGKIIRAAGIKAE